ncbi:MAG: ABC transporter ATP-binding protein [Spirochaetota bacterium]
MATLRLMGNPVISVEHLHKSYGELEAVSDLSFEVEPSTCYAFLGPNGAGKSTMMRTLYGKAVPDPRPETHIRVLGFDPRSHELEVKSRCGVVPQDNSLDVELNVEDNLKIYARLYGLPRTFTRERIDYLLEFMELTEKRRSRVRELSGGMQRRLIIARGLINNPALLILDEPTTGLDPQVRHLIWDKLRGLMREGVTVLLTTHYMDEAFQISDKLLIMDRGKKVLEGHPGTLLEAHMERHVLELFRPELEAEIGVDPKVAGNGGGAAGLRREASSQRVLYYADEAEALKRLADKLRPGDYFLRPANLEDLFLKTTGRHLNEVQ